MTLMALLLTNQSVTPKTASWEDVESEARAGSYQLISTTDLAKKYADKNDPPLIIDTRQAWEYRAGHIKGALNFPMEPTWLSRWRKKGDLAHLLGPDKDRFIVFY